LKVVVEDEAVAKEIKVVNQVVIMIMTIKETKVNIMKAMMKIMKKVNNKKQSSILFSNLFSILSNRS
jgi:PleD family two-component response regulator